MSATAAFAIRREKGPRDGAYLLHPERLSPRAQPYEDEARQGRRILMPTTTATSTTLNSLLRGEMSALETYRQAIQKLEGSNAPGLQELHSLRADHRDAADALWHHIEGHGGKPSEDSGPWGGWAKLVEGTAKLLGSAAALKALKEGEEH